MDYFYTFLLLTEQVCTKNMEQFTQSYQVLFESASTLKQCLKTIFFFR